MSQTEFDFSDKTLSGEERLANLLALSRGFFLAMQNLFERVDVYNALLEEELEDRPGALEYLGRSRGAVGKAVEWLGGFQRMVQGATEFEKVDLRPLLEGVVQRCRKVFPGDIVLESVLEDEATVVQGAVFQLQDLFFEVLGSTVPQLPGGSAVLRAEPCALRKSDLSLLRSPCPAGDYVAVTLGVSPEPFRLDAQTTFWEALLGEQGVGADDGLRLLHAYGIIREHGGDIFFGRVPEARSVAMVLPVEGKRKDMQVVPNIDDERLLGDETILLVDDEDMIWDVIIDMLQELGYSVILAGNGLEAVEIYRENVDLVDLVMLDMVMPEMDGHKAFFRLKEIDPDVCVLLSSGYVSEDEARDVLDAGAVGFLQKPYRMVDLAGKIRSILDKRSR